MFGAADGRGAAEGGRRPARLPRVVALGALGSLATLAACSSAAPRTINPDSAAHQISAQLAARYHLPAPQVSCPAGVQAQPGRTFECTTSLAGQPVRMEARVTSTSGAFTVAPAVPILVTASVANQLGSEIGQRSGSPATVTCPGPPVLVVEVHHTFTCSASLPGEPPRAVTVTVVDDRGDFGFELAPAA